jgi:hypothetical protein
MSVGIARTTPPTPTLLLDGVTVVELELGLADRSTA